MKKSKLLIAPLLIMPILTSCGGGKKPKPTVFYTLKFEGTHYVMKDTSGNIVTQKAFEAGETASFHLVGETEEFEIPKKEKIAITYTETGKTFDGTYSYNEEDGSLSIKMTADVTVAASSEFLWYLNTTYLNGLTEADVTKDGGEIQTLKVNGLDHRVRLIGVEEDVDGKGNKIHTTWEFADLISDENGYSLATYWNDTATTTGSNHDYTTSTVHNALVGEGNVNWFRFYGTEHDSDTNLSFATQEKYKISVLKMLDAENEGLVDVLKAPSKYVNIYNTQETKFDERTFEDKLFLLSPAEMGRTSRDHEESKTSTYSYYKNTAQGGSEEAKRIKHQIKWHDGARETNEGLKSTNLAGAFTGNDKYCFAGYNNPTENYGGHPWLRSPHTNTDGNLHAFSIKSNGSIYGVNYTTEIEDVFRSALAVAPAFCI